MESEIERRAMAPVKIFRRMRNTDRPCGNGLRIWQKPVMSVIFVYAEYVWTVWAGGVGVLHITMEYK